MSCDGVKESAERETESIKSVYVYFSLVRLGRDLKIAKITPGRVHMIPHHNIYGGRTNNNKRIYSNNNNKSVQHIKKTSTNHT